MTAPARTSTGTRTTSSRRTWPPEREGLIGRSSGRLWPSPRFSSYDFGVVSERQIQESADEAEAGYDIDELKRRGRGRPGRGAAPMQVVAVRLTADELDALDAAAAKNHMSRSEAIRAALAQLCA
jgi:hypothetical protein